MGGNQLANAAGCFGTGFNGRIHDHSLHSVTVGPDGQWYWNSGNCGAQFTDKSGKVLELLSATGRARIEGVAMIKRHLKKSQEHPQGTIAEREGSVHISNLMLQSVYDASTKRKKSAPAAS